MHTADTQAARIETVTLRYAVGALVLSFPTLCLLVNRGDSYVLGLLAILGGWIGLRHGFARNLRRTDWNIAAVYALAFVVAILAYEAGQATDRGFNILGRDLRFLFAIPALVALRRFPPPPRLVFASLAVAAALAGIDAMAGLMHASAQYRAMGTAETPVIFGDLSACLMLSLAAAYPLVAGAGKRWVTIGFFLCLLLVLVAVILSGTRSGWLALLLLLPLIVREAKRAVSRTHFYTLLTGLVAALAVLYVNPGTHVRERVTQIVNQVAMYHWSLESVQRDAHARIAAQPYCSDQRAFLRYWLMLAGHAPELSAQIVSDPALRSMQDTGINCPAGFVIHLRNSADSGWIDFLRAPRDPGATQVTRLLARGSGTFQLYGYRHGPAKEVVHFDSSNYTLVTLHGGPYIGTDVAIYFSPGQNLWLVPIEGYAGEYRNTLMGTSVGVRFEMWRAAWQMFLSHPLLGVGTGAFETSARQLAREGRTIAAAAQYDHPHSDYMDALSSRGLIGLVALLALLLVPAMHFRRGMKLPQPEQRAAALAGLLLVCGFAICGLTDTVFIHSMNISWYVVLVGVFAVLCSPDPLPESRQASPGNGVPPEELR